jgi:Ran GTPase-activating protein (RanGAP) involved in mRNA processing and transport
MKFFQRLLSIPSLKNLNLKENTLGNEGLKYLCHFMKENETLEVLKLYCMKKRRITRQILH